MVAATHLRLEAHLKIPVVREAFGFPILLAFLNKLTQMKTRTLLSVLSHCHQSGDNTMLRAGAEPSGSREAGVFHSTTISEQTAKNHGPATAYCDRPYYSYYSSGHEYYLIATGPGTTTHIDAYLRVHEDCRTFVGGYSDHAHCSSTSPSGSCPLGWGSQKDYFAYRPGCYSGSRFPYPTQASDTSPFTGSLHNGSCIEPVLINENLCQ